MDKPLSAKTPPSTTKMKNSDLSQYSALKQTLLRAKTIGYSEGGSGVYVSTELLKRLAIADQVASKMKLVTGELVGEAISRGDVEVGIQQIGEIKTVQGVDYLGPLPDDLQLAAIITAAVPQTARADEAARAFVTFLQLPEATKAFTDDGLSVPPTRWTRQRAWPAPRGRPLALSYVLRMSSVADAASSTEDALLPKSGSGLRDETG